MRTIICSCLFGQTKSNVAEDSLFSLYGNSHKLDMYPKWGEKRTSLMVECPNRLDITEGWVLFFRFISELSRYLLTSHQALEHSMRATVSISTPCLLILDCAIASMPNHCWRPFRVHLTWLPFLKGLMNWMMVWLL